MKIAVMVLEGPYQHQAVDSAYNFVKAALARGHEIVGIFLYTDGVNNANKFIKPPGERNISKRMDELGEQGIEVVACTACSKFRGMRPNLAVENVRLSGLGSLAKYLEEADRFVTFGD
ncbi:MAG: DsrE family protein [Chloroflexota bacterium]|nr:DsrE family protein [Chloroflexota bacterium]